MAVYTQISSEALDAHLKRYDIGHAVSFKGIAEGVENSNYLLNTNQAPYILTLYEKRVNKEDLPFFIQLMEHLHNKGFACPQPVRMKNGEALGELSGRPAAIVSFLEGIGVDHPIADQCRMAGETMARLHLAAGDLVIKRKNALDPAGWRPLVEANTARADEVEPELAKLISEQMNEIEKSWPTYLPSSVIHGDFFKDNVFFLEGKLSGVIDFYFACNDFMAYDLAIAINAWCFRDDLTFDSELSAALIAGYQSVRALEQKEVDAFPILVRGAALRFLATRLNDWLNVPQGALVIPHNPKPYSARLRFHAGANDAASYGLT